MTPSLPDEGKSLGHRARSDLERPRESGPGCLSARSDVLGLMDQNLLHF